MNIIFRCDSSVEIGGGHVMRCLALALELKSRGHDCSFVCQPLQGNLIDLLKKEGFAVQTIPVGKSELEDASATPKGDWMILDHYKLGHEWEKYFRSKQCKVLSLQDFPARPLACNIVLDQNFYISENPYDIFISSNTKALVGPQYALLREEFSQSRPAPASRLPPQRVFVFFGATDPQQGLLKYADALVSAQLDLDFTFVSGPTCPHNSALHNLLSKMGRFDHIIHPSTMAKVMCQHDIYLGAGGTITWERMSQGLTGIVMAVADNQIPAAEALSQKRYHDFLGPIHDIAPERVIEKLLAYKTAPHELLSMRQACAQLVDAKGAKRVADALTYYVEH